MPHKIKKKKQKESKHLSPQVESVSRAALADTEAPEGFRQISASQAIMEYARPIMELAENNPDKLNEALQIVMILWNYSISFQQSGKEDKKVRATILEALKVKFKLRTEEAMAFLNEMVERYAYLFPQEVQPDTPLTLFIRKETSTRIEPFDYSNLVVPQNIIPPEKRDLDLISKIKKLDSYITSNADYGEFEELIFTVMDGSKEMFQKWLDDKGLSKKVEQFNFIFCIEPYLQFIYGYMHKDIVTLKIISLDYIREFFHDFLLRKVVVENPAEYVEWIPALKLFYRFLYEKEYIADPDDIIGAIDSIEPDFITILRKQFS
jgi:hypothetical protein